MLSATSRFLSTTSYSEASLLTSVAPAGPAQYVEQEQAVGGGHVAGAEQGVGAAVAEDMRHAEAVALDRHAAVARRHRDLAFPVACVRCQQRRVLEVVAELAVGEVFGAAHQRDKPAERDRRHDELDDVVSTIGSSFLGLTIGCARCHEHKFDPISQKNYYEMFAYFHQLPELGSGRGASNAPPMIHVSALPRLKRLETLQKKLEPLEEAMQARADTP